MNSDILGTLKKKKEVPFATFNSSLIILSCVLLLDWGIISDALTSPHLKFHFPGMWSKTVYDDIWNVNKRRGWNCTESESFTLTRVK